MRLVALGAESLDPGADRADVDDRAMCFSRPQLKLGFRFLEKFGTSSSLNGAHNEQKARASTGWMVPCKFVTQRTSKQSGGQLNQQKRVSDGR